MILTQYSKGKSPTKFLSWPEPAAPGQTLSHPSTSWAYHCCSVQVGTGETNMAWAALFKFTTNCIQNRDINKTLQTWKSASYDWTSLGQSSKLHLEPWKKERAKRTSKQTIECKHMLRRAFGGGSWLCRTDTDRQERKITYRINNLEVGKRISNGKCALADALYRRVITKHPWHIKTTKHYDCRDGVAPKNLSHQWLICIKDAVHMHWTWAAHAKLVTTVLTWTPKLKQRCARLILGWVMSGYWPGAADPGWAGIWCRIFPH